MHDETLDCLKWMESLFIKRLNNYNNFLNIQRAHYASFSADTLNEYLLLKDTEARYELYNYFFKEELLAVGLDIYSKNQAAALDAVAVLLQKVRTVYSPKIENPCPIILVSTQTIPFNDKFILEGSHTDTSNVGLVVDGLPSSGTYNFKGLTFTIEPFEVFEVTAEIIQNI